MSSKSHEYAHPGAYSMTRREVAEQLRCSVSTVRRMEYDTLHPISDERGIIRFDPQEVTLLAHGRPVRPLPANPRRPSLGNEDRRRGRLAARVFAMFATGWSLRRIVVQVKAPPDVVRALYHEWHTSLEVGEWSQPAGDCE